MYHNTHPYYVWAACSRVERSAEPSAFTHATETPRARLIRLFKLLRQFEVVAVLLDGLNSGMQSGVETRAKLNFIPTSRAGPPECSAKQPGFA